MKNEPHLVLEIEIWKILTFWNDFYRNPHLESQCHELLIIRVSFDPLNQNMEGTAILNNA